jgi:hypothetical protein
MKERRGADHEAWRLHWKLLEGYNGAVAALRTTRVPVLLAAGSEDGAARGVLEFKERHGGDHFILEGRDHVMSLVDPAARDVVLARLREHIERAEAAAP